MSRKIACGLSLVLGCSPLLAQDIKIEAEADSKIEAAIESPALTRPDENPDGLAPWAHVEFLNWWIRPGPLNYPLITRGEPGIPVAGALLRPGTIALTDSKIDFGSQTGVRATVGTWLDREHSVAMEASVFTLFQSDGDKLTLGTAGIGTNGLYVPAYRPDRGRQGSMIISDPVIGFSGFVSLDTTTQFSGAEANGLVNVSRNRGMSIDLLAGFRYADLQEHLNFGGLSSDLILLNDFTFVDQFRTRNQFYGGQVGFNGTLANDCWFVSLRGTVAVGATEQTVDVQGASQLTGTANGNFLGGFYSQLSNIGTRTTCDFSVMPQAGVKIGVTLANCVSVFAGYDCMYWRQVVRPGSQIDFRVDTPIPLGGALPITPTPVQFFNRTDFWAHGASIGIDFRY